MDEILKIIAKCNKARKLLSIDDVKKICYIVRKNNGYDFVKRVVFGKKHPSVPGRKQVTQCPSPVLHPILSESYLCDPGHNSHCGHCWPLV